MSERKVIDKKVMAMGGIDLEHIPFLRDNGFGGIVLLGIASRFTAHKISARLLAISAKSARQPTSTTLYQTEFLKTYLKISPTHE